MEEIMKKILLVVVVMCMFMQVASADLYVTFSRETGEIMGTASISDEGVLEWTKKHILKKADESYRGKQPYEIKYEDGVLRLATQEEIDTYKTDIKAEKDQVINDKEKEKFLKWLDNVDVKTKIKNIKVN